MLQMTLEPTFALASVDGAPSICRVDWLDGRLHDSYHLIDAAGADLDCWALLRAAGAASPRNDHHANVVDHLPPQQALEAEAQKIARHRADLSADGVRGRKR